MRSLLIILLLSISTSLNSAIYYVATNGNNNAAGTIGAPWATWQKAFDTAQPGDIIYFRGGVYTPATKADANPYTSGTCLIDPDNSHGNSGTEADWISYFAYPGETPILDCSLLNPDAAGFNVGLVINNAQFLHFKGLTIRNVWQNGQLDEAWGISATYSANLIFENMTVHDISGRGYWIQGGAWGSYAANPPCTYDTTKFLNCDTYNICDSIDYTGGSSPGNSGDCFKLIYYSGNYVLFDGNRMWNYTDDGADPNNIVVNGVPATIIFRNNWFMSSAKYLPVNADIEGNGLKFGAAVCDSVDTPGYLAYNNLAMFCIGDGFTANLEINGTLCPTGNFDAKPVYYNNTSYYTHSAFAVDNRNNMARGQIFRNNLAYRYSYTNYLVRMYYPSVYTESHNTWDATQLTGVPSWPGWETSDTITVTDADFVTVDSASLVTLFTAARQADGSLPTNKPLQLASTSDLINMGVDIPASDGTGISIVSDNAPEIGYAQYNESVGAPLVATGVQTALSIKRATARGTVTSDGGATVTERGIVYGTSANPTTSNNKVVVTGTTGAFTASLTELSSNTTYHVRSYAINSEGTSYGADETFTTPASSRIKSSTGKITMENGKIIIVQ